MNSFVQSITFWQRKKINLRQSTTVEQRFSWRDRKKRILEPEALRMWGTSQGDRTLVGPEGELIRKAVGFLRDMITAGIDLDEPFQSEVMVYNVLQPTQQLAVLHEVAFALLDDSVPIPELTAVREATVYTIYRALVSLIDIEIDLAKDSRIPDDSSRMPEHQWVTCPEYQTRRMVSAACLQVQLQPEWQTEWSPSEPCLLQPPDIFSVDLKKWSYIVELLANQVLWDRDFEMEAIFADHDPLQIADIKAYLGIHEDYFSTPAPDVFSLEFQRIDRELVNLTRDG